MNSRNISPDPNYEVWWNDTVGFHREDGPAIIDHTKQRCTWYINGLSVQASTLFEGFTTEQKKAAAFNGTMFPIYNEAYPTWPFSYIDLDYDVVTFGFNNGPSISLKRPEQTITVPCEKEARRNVMNEFGLK